MLAFIVTFGVGILCIILGISHRRGNLSTLHSYHRNRVSEEDRIPFGKQVGLGMIIMGLSIVLFSILSMISLYADNELFVLIGNGIMIAGILLGSIISFSAMKKYNKGIF